MPDYDAILDALIERNYYSEEWELQGAFLSWVESRPSDRSQRRRPN